jgi:hypothetical protein
LQNKRLFLKYQVELSVYLFKGEVPIFSLAFGKDADWNLMKSMSIRNDGIARKIYEDSDSDLQVSKSYFSIYSTYPRLHVYAEN